MSGCTKGREMLHNVSYLGFIVMDFLGNIGIVFVGIIWAFYKDVVCRF